MVLKTVQNLFVLHLTSNCPYSCPICFSNKKEDIFSEELLDEIIGLAKKLKVSYFNFSGGEPLLHPQLEHIVRKSVANKISVNIVTSGFSLTEKKLSCILDANVSRIFISLNSTSEEINKISREGYKETISALKLLSKIAPAKSAINFCVGSENIDDFLSITDMASNLNIPLVCVLLRKPNKNGVQLCTIKESQLLTLANDIKSITNGPIVAIDPCFIELFKLLESSNAVLLPTSLQGCNPGFNRLTFYPDRTISLCPHLYKRYPIEQLAKLTENRVHSDQKLCFKQLY